MPTPISQPHKIAYFAGGCFWCTESEYRRLDGVLDTDVGYMGGATNNPTYEQISTGKTGHAEVIKIFYDPDITPYQDLVSFFLIQAHDPTQLNRQGVDVGTQYRSAIFPIDKEQEDIARRIIADVQNTGLYKDPIVTTIEPLSTFWVAEEYHQQYYDKYKADTGKDHIRVQLKKIGKL